MVGYFIAFFELAIILTVLLHCIIGKMGKEIFSILDAVLTRGCSYVTFSIPIAFHLSIVAIDCHVVPDIKFSSLI